MGHTHLRQNTAKFRYYVATATKSAFSQNRIDATIFGWPIHTSISALRAKRALISGLIEKLRRKLEQHRADLLTLMAYCGCFSLSTYRQHQAKALLCAADALLRTQRAVAARYGCAQSR